MNIFKALFFFEYENKILYLAYGKLDVNKSNYRITPYKGMFHIY